MSGYRYAFTVSSLMHARQALCPLSYTPCLFNFYYHPLVKAGLTNPDPPAAASQSAEVTGIHHSIQPSSLSAAATFYLESSSTLNLQRMTQHSSTPEPLEIQASPCAHLCSKYGLPCASSPVLLFFPGDGGRRVYSHTHALPDLWL